MKTLSWMLGLGVLVAVVGCGDDESTGDATTGAGATGNTGNTGNTGGSGASGGDAAGGDGGTATGGTGNAGGAGGGTGTLTCEASACDGTDQECSCEYDCEVCDGADCTDLEFSVSCVDGINGVTCTCTFEGVDPTTCSQPTLTCSEESCCAQFRR